MVASKQGRLLPTLTEECSTLEYSVDENNINEHVQYESYHMIGVGVEHRYIQDIVETMIEDGFEMDIDFSVM